MLTILKAGNLALSFLLEVCMLAALGYWGVQTGQETLAKIALGVGAPLLVAVVWGVFCAPKAAKRLQGPALPLVELVLFGAALALYATSHPALAATFAALVIGTTVLMQVWGQ
jgi:uncharacterized protein DUF2568